MKRILSLILTACVISAMFNSVVFAKVETPVLNEVTFESVQEDVVLTDDNVSTVLGSEWSLYTQTPANFTSLERGIKTVGDSRALYLAGSSSGKPGVRNVRYTLPEPITSGKVEISARVKQVASTPEVLMYINGNYNGTEYPIVIGGLSAYGRVVATVPKKDDANPASINKELNSTRIRNDVNGSLDDAWVDVRYVLDLDTKDISIVEFETSFNWANDITSEFTDDRFTATYDSEAQRITVKSNSTMVTPSWQPENLTAITFGSTYYPGTCAFDNISIKQIGSTELKSVSDFSGNEITEGSTIWNANATGMKLQFNGNMPSLMSSDITLKKGETTVNVNAVLGSDQKSYDLTFDKLSAGNYTLTVPATAVDADGDAVIEKTINFTVTDTMTYDFGSIGELDETKLKELYPGFRFEKGDGLSLRAGLESHNYNKVGNGIVISYVKSTLPSQDTAKMPYFEIPFPKQTENFEVTINYGSNLTVAPYAMLVDSTLNKAFAKVGHNQADNRSMSYYTGMDTEEKANRIYSTGSASANQSINYGSSEPWTVTLKVNMLTKTYDFTGTKKHSIGNYVTGTAKAARCPNGTVIDPATSSIYRNNIPLEEGVDGANALRIGAFYPSASTVENAEIVVKSVTIKSLENEPDVLKINRVDFVQDCSGDDDAVYLNRGAKETNLANLKEAKLMLSAVNTTNEAVSVQPVIAIYKSDKTLRDIITIGRFDMEPNSAVSLTQPIWNEEFVYYTFNEGDSVRLFIWNNITGLKPLNIFDDGLADTITYKTAE